MTDLLDAALARLADAIAHLLIRLVIVAQSFAPKGATK